MKYIVLIFCLTWITILSSAQNPEDTEDWSRSPDVVTPGINNSPPQDAIILYSSGSEYLDKWQHKDGSIVKWDSEDFLTVVKGTGNIFTRQSFGDCQLHIEWRTPSEVKGKSQGRGNSGIYLMGLYEVQVLDSYNNETYYNGQAGAIYKQHIPLVNACRPPGEWQEYDIIFTAPRFNGDKSLKSPAYFTVLHNGVLIQNHVELKGPTEHKLQPKYKYHKEKLPLMLQDHSNPVSFRNIWIREL